MKTTLYNQPTRQRTAKEVLFHLGLCYSSRKDTLLGYWCFLNRICYMVAVKSGLVESSLDTKQLTIKNLNNIRHIYSHCEIHLGLKNLEEHAKKHWNTGSTHRETMRKYRASLATLGVFKCTESSFRPDARRRTPPAKIYNINFIMCLELIDLIEDLLREKGVVIPATDLTLLFEEIEYLKKNACNTGEKYAQEMIAEAEKKIERILKDVAQGKRGTVPLHSGAFTSGLLKKLFKWANGDDVLMDIYSFAPPVEFSSSLYYC